MNIEEFKENHCKDCGNNHACKDLDGDLIDERVLTCMDSKKVIELSVRDVWEILNNGGVELKDFIIKLK